MNLFFNALPTLIVPIVDLVDVETEAGLIYDSLDFERNFENNSETKFEGVDRGSNTEPMATTQSDVDCVSTRGFVFDSVCNIASPAAHPVYYVFSPSSIFNGLTYDLESVFFTPEQITEIIDKFDDGRVAVSEVVRKELCHLLLDIIQRQPGSITTAHLNLLKNKFERYLVRKSMLDALLSLDTRSEGRSNNYMRPFNSLLDPNLLLEIDKVYALIDIAHVLSEEMRTRVGDQCRELVADFLISLAYSLLKGRQGGLISCTLPAQLLVYRLLLQRLIDIEWWVGVYIWIDFVIMEIDTRQSGIVTNNNLFPQDKLDIVIAQLAREEDEHVCLTLTSIVANAMERHCYEATEFERILRERELVRSSLIQCFNQLWFDVIDHDEINQGTFMEGIDFEAAGIDIKALYEAHYKRKKGEAFDSSLWWED